MSESSVLDRIGNDSSDASSETDHPKSIKKKSISLKAVIDSIDNSPIKKPSSPKESVTQVTKLCFGQVEREPPPLKPAPSHKVEDQTEDEDTSGPKIIEKEKFWEYVEIDEKPRDKKKKRLTGELARLADTDEYLEASGAIKSDATAPERSKRPPRRAAILARENVNVLHGNMDNVLELRGTRIDANADKKENSEDSIFNNPDLFDIGSPESDKEDDMITVNLPSKSHDKQKAREERMKLHESVMNDVFDKKESDKGLSSFKIPKKKKSERSEYESSSSKLPKLKKIKTDIENRKRKVSENERPREKQKDSKISKKEKNTRVELNDGKCSASDERKENEKSIKTDERKRDNGNDQKQCRERVNYLCEYFNNWVKQLPSKNPV